MAHFGASFGAGSGPIFLGGLRCDGTESNILDCDRYNPLGIHECSHSKDAGVSCIGTLLHIMYITSYLES